MSYLDAAGFAHFWAGMKNRIAQKQDRLTGTAGQFVGFDASGAPVAVAAPETVTMAEVNAVVDEAVTGAMKAAY